MATLYARSLKRDEIARIPVRALFARKAMRRAVARALALVAVSSVVSTCLAKVYPPDVSPFCRARASGGLR